MLIQYTLGIIIAALFGLAVYMDMMRYSYEKGYYKRVKSTKTLLLEDEFIVREYSFRIKFFLHKQSFFLENLSQTSRGRS